MEKTLDVACVKEKYKKDDEIEDISIALSFRLASNFPSTTQFDASHFHLFFVNTQL